MTDRRTVLVVGASGLFGELLARRILSEDEFELVAAGRKTATLQEMFAGSDAKIVCMDRDDERAVARVLNESQPFAVVDCAGPFQYYGSDPYRFARQVIENGSHYLDIADATEFVCEIDELNDLAKKNDVVAVAGASTTPAISAAVADALTDDMGRVISIETSIVPGNRARRTFSVMKAILGQIGQPISARVHGEDIQIIGWSGTQKIDLSANQTKHVKGRLASYVNTPDLALFPDRYNAETVLFRAGLEITIFHRLLILARQLVRLKLIRSLAPFAGLFRWIASWFESLGSDQGGMKVAIIGETQSEVVVCREWDLIASDGKGPGIPTVPVSILLAKLKQGKLKSGAYTGAGIVPLAETEEHLKLLGAAIDVHERRLKSVFGTVLKDKITELPVPVQHFHTRFGKSTYTGAAKSAGPTGILGRVVASLFGFPGKSDDVPVEVTVLADGQRELWVRSFDGSKFHSHLSVGKGGKLQERFGPFQFTIDLEVGDNSLHYPVVSGRFLGIFPVPKFLLPSSTASETVDSAGRFNFDVKLDLPFGGRIGHYQGWLVMRDPKGGQS